MLPIHKYQKKVLDSFEKGKLNHYFLSASTSFGKTYLIYEIIKNYDDDVFYGYRVQDDYAKFVYFKKIVKDCIDNKCDMTWR